MFLYLNIFLKVVIIWLPKEVYPPALLKSVFGGLIFIFILNLGTLGNFCVGNFGVGIFGFENFGNVNFAMDLFLFLVIRYKRLKKANLKLLNFQVPFQFDF